MDLLSWNVSKKEEEVVQVQSGIKTLDVRYSQEKEVLNEFDLLANWTGSRNCRPTNG